MEIRTKSRRLLTIDAKTDELIYEYGKYGHVDKQTLFDLRAWAIIKKGDAYFKCFDFEDYTNHLRILSDADSVSFWGVTQIRFQNLWK